MRAQANGAGLGWPPEELACHLRLARGSKLGRRDSLEAKREGRRAVQIRVGGEQMWGAVVSGGAFLKREYL